jgi:DNA-directed RNA polymerase subunit beta
LNLANYARINDYGFIETPYRKVINALPLRMRWSHCPLDLEDEKGKVIVKAGAKITDDAAKKLAKVKNQVTWPVKAKVTSEIVYLDASKKNRPVIAGAGSEVRRKRLLCPSALVPEYLQSGEVDANDVTYMDAARNQIIGSSAGLIPFIEKNYVYRSH